MSSNDNLFDSTFFVANRQRLCQLFTGKAPIVLTASGLLQRGGDEEYPFRQDGSFWYLTGLNIPNAILVIDKAREYVILPMLSAAKQAFDGVLDPSEVTRISGIKEVYFAKEGWQILKSRLRKVQHVATINAPTAFVEQLGMYTNPARAELIRRLKEINSELELLDLHQHLLRMRMVKQPLELKAIQASIDVTIASLKEILRSAKLTKYAYEYEVEGELTRAFRRRGARHSFAPVIAGGKRACQIHNMENNGKLSPGELLLLDVGSEFDRYCSDISRTIALNDKPTTRQQAVFNAVLEVRDYALSLLKPGVIIIDYERQIETFMGEKLRELGLIKIIDSVSVRQFYPHATSHFLGIDVHDAGDYFHPLEAGVVITVEPGIYIPDEGLGIRIEDDILITETGVVNLSEHLPAVL